MLENIIKKSSGFIIYIEGEFQLISTPPSKEQNRETLARLFTLMEKEGLSPRNLFNQLSPLKKDSSLPTIIRRDRFLTHYALGLPIPIKMVQELMAFSSQEEESASIQINYQDEKMHFFDVGSTLPGFRAKLSSKMRLKADCELLEKVRHDLHLASQIEDHEKRKAITLALLSFSAAYRELEGKILEIADFEQPNHLVSYQCKQHLIADGLKTLSLSAGKKAPPLYLCQGTELWPSQPLMLGSILANLAEHGSATQAYAHSWRRIHKQLRDLAEEAKALPIVMGHSMGGALALQIALYSHDLIDSAHAYNPPVPNERDALFFKSLSDPIKKKVNLYVNLDDPAFFRIGAKVFGNVTLLMGKKRWRYYPVTLKDSLLFFPAIIKFLLNIKHAFPAHQKILSLCSSSLAVTLSEEEIALENEERIDRFDALHFLPKLYDPMRTFIALLRKLFKWNMEEEFLCNEIEILALHERDLLDTATESNEEEIKEKVNSIKIQKESLQKQLFSLKNNYGRIKEK